MWILQVTELVEQINGIFLDEIKNWELKISARREKKFSKMFLSLEGFCLVISVTGKSRLILYGPCIILQYRCNPTGYTVFYDWVYS